MTEPTGAKLLPFYLVVDVSASMSGKKIDSANRILPTVVDVLGENPILSDKVRFGLVDFADDAHVVLPLCDLLDRDLVLPTLTTRGSTSYAAAFRLLKTEIEANVKQLKADGYSVHRPAVFFLSDGMPNGGDGWEGAFRDLTEWDPVAKTGFRPYPNVVPCGVDDADGAILARLVHPSRGDKAMKLFLMNHGYEPADAITAMAEILISSVIASTQSMAEGNSGMMLPHDKDLPAGVSAYDPDDFI